MPADSPTNEDIQAVMLAAMKKVRADVANPDEASALDDDIARLEEGPVDMGETGWAVMRETAKGLAALSASPARREGEAPSRWSAVRNLFVRHAEAFNKATRYEEASAIADKAGREIEELFAPPPGEGDAPVAWRYRYYGADGTTRPWTVRQSPIVARDPSPGWMGTEVEALYTHPTPATPAGERTPCADHQAAGYHLDPCCPHCPASPAGEELRLLERFGQDICLELSFGYDPDEEGDTGAWMVYRRSGNRSDREWTLIGKGETPQAAILAALQPQAEGGGGHGRGER